MWRIVACCFLTMLSATAHAQFVFTYDVEAQPLADALRIIAHRSNMNILYDPNLVRGRTTLALRMQATPVEALTKLLEGTGLKIQYVNEKTVTLVPLPVQMIVERPLIAPADTGMGASRVVPAKASEK
jgi:hypothetical protein